jgi:hypothetical protein
MNLLSILSGGVDKVVDSVGNAIDSLVTSDEERMQLRNALEEAKMAAMLQSENNYLKHEQQITERWVSDNEHVLTRLVRPAVVVWSYFLFTVVMLFDGNIGGFAVKASYVPVLETILITVTVAYFGSRGYEKGKRYSASRVAEEFRDV